MVEERKLLEQGRAPALQEKTRPLRSAYLSRPYAEEDWQPRARLLRLQTEESWLVPASTKRSSYDHKKNTSDYLIRHLGPSVCQEPEVNFLQSKTLGNLGKVDIKNDQVDEEVKMIAKVINQLNFTVKSTD
ncbi:hypothetical protein CB1_000984004 [Camelus ferus]|nr:hypothetical protein CB1_000984004 [Camelus ferus]